MLSLEAMVVMRSMEAVEDMEGNLTSPVSHSRCKERT